MQRINFRRHGIPVALMLTLLVGVFLPLSIAEEVEGPRYGGTLVYGLDTEPPHLNIGITSANQEGAVCGNIFNALLSFNSPTLEPVPELATNWTISEDGLTYTFKLVENATWHDGTPFTSADVQYTFMEVKKVYHPTGKTKLQYLEAVETPDDYTAVFKLSKPFVPLLFELGSTSVSLILPKHLYEGTDLATNPYNWEPVGTGPFKFKEWVEGSHIELERNDNYWKKGLPYLDRIVFKIIPDSATRALSMETGEIDYLQFYSTPAADVSRLDADPDITYTVSGTECLNVIQYCLFNLRRPITGNIKVRQAIMYAIDREEMVEKAFYNLGSVSTAPFHERPAWCHNPNLPQYERNVTKANQLLDDAGYPKGTNGIRFELEILGVSGRARELKIAEIMKEQLQDVGIDLQINILEYATVIDKAWVNYDFDIVEQHLYQGFEPTIGGERLYVSWNIRPAMATNVMGYNKSRVDELFETARTSLSQDDRQDSYYEIQEILWDDVPAIWVWDWDEPKVYRNEFVNIITKIDSYNQRLEEAWWTGGSLVSPESASAAIEDAEDEIANLKGWWLNDVTDAQAKLDEARTAFDAADYAGAERLANEAVGLATPPYEIYAAIAITIIVIAVVAVFLYRRRRKA